MTTNTNAKQWKARLHNSVFIESFKWNIVIYNIY